MVHDYLRPSSLEEALAAKAKNPGAAFLAGGTFLLAGDLRDKPRAVIDVGRILPRDIERKGSSLSLGAGATFQDLLDSSLVPGVLKTAVQSMVNRNVRNRATVGGNLGAAKSCASLIPLAIALDASLVVAQSVASATATVTLPVSDWMANPKGLLLAIRFELPKGTRAAFSRHARTACDLSVLTLGLAFGLEGGKIKGLRVAMGGLGPRARRFPDVEALFEGKAIPPKAEIESSALVLFTPRADWRGSAEFKKTRAASLLADALHGAEEIQ